MNVSSVHVTDSFTKCITLEYVTFAVHTNMHSAGADLTTCTYTPYSKYSGPRHHDTCTVRVDDTLWAGSGAG